MDIAPRVLLFDDEPLVRETISRMLSSHGFTVVAGHDGLDGLKQVKEGGYDVLVTDLFMPEVDGIELLQATRKARPDIPIICMSGGGSHLPDDFGSKLLQGFNVRILAKPFGSDALLSTLHAALTDRP
ncbi:MAG TPA: response regulator [Parvibaculum sp.]|jgi:CheY-like chemotaxis protein